MSCLIWIYTVCKLTCPAYYHHHHRFGSSVAWKGMLVSSVDLYISFFSFKLSGLGDTERSSGIWVDLHDFLSFLRREITFVTSCLLS